MLFISKEVKQFNFLAYAKAAEINIIAVSMISFIEIPFECPKSDYDIVFFTSPRSVKFFLKQCALPSNVEIATIGKVTTDFLEAEGHTVSFTGVTSGLPEAVSKEFKTFARGRNVLFPQSNYSQRSMQKNLLDQQVKDLVAYKTKLTPQKLKEKPSVLVFTSPTNVESFLKLNKISAEQKVIAWGKTTEAFLHKNGIKAEFTLKTSSFDELQVILEEHFYPTRK